MYVFNTPVYRNGLRYLAKLAKLATAVTAVKAGDSEFTSNDGIKYLSDVDIEMKLRFSCQQNKTSGIFLSDPGPIMVNPCH